MRLFLIALIVVAMILLATTTEAHPHQWRGWGPPMRAYKATPTGVSVRKGPLGIFWRKTWHYELTPGRWEFVPDNPARAYGPSILRR